MEEKLIKIQDIEVVQYIEKLQSKLDRIEEHILKANVNSLIGGHKDKFLSIIKGDDNK